MQPAPAATTAGRPTADGRLTADELLDASGLDVPMLRELEQFGLVAGITVAGATEYDDDDQTVAKAAAGFTRHGFETRHLRSYLTAATREADLYGQVVLPMLRQRTPTSRRKAAATLDELARLGEELRTALLRRAVREHLGRR
ncbi:MAG: hypothetical protein H0U89_02955 [Acidimicrobiia bacterium]|nr:hypothetical protein [Acidimicrobiia bacterium]